MACSNDSNPHSSRQTNTNLPAFEAVKSLNILQLPSRSSLQSFTSANIQNPGVSCDYLFEQWKAYKTHCAQVPGPKPVGESILIFDEVKVQNGVSTYLRISL